MDSKLHILQHSLGLNKYGEGNQYRNHFATGPNGKDFDDCVALAEMGLMKDYGTLSFTGDMHCFVVTPAGIDYVALNSPPVPKVSRSKARYGRFLKYGDMFDSFLDFCRWDSEPERSWNGGRA
jgi:hypothetical protein